MLQQIVDIFAGNPWVLVGLAAVGAALYYLDQELDDNAFEAYDGKSLEERVRYEVKFLVNSVGTQIDKPMKIGKHFNNVGTVYKYCELEMNDEGIMTATGGFYGDQDDEDTASVMVFLIAPEGFKRLLWKISDIYFGRDRSTKMYVIYEDYVDEDVADYFHISEEAQFMPYAGMMVQKGAANINVAQDIALKQALEAATNYFPDYAEELSERDVAHAQKMAEVKQLQEGEAQSMLEDLANN